jgi:hypothetical protein
MAVCGICQRSLDQPDDPTTENCGGHCLRCVAESGDTSCESKMNVIYLRNLADRIFRIPVMYSVDQGDCDKLREIARAIEYEVIY